MGLKQIHKQEFKMISTWLTKKRKRLVQLNESGVVDLIMTTLSTNFTWPTTLGRRHQSPPYSILCASPQGLHPNVTFPWDSQVGVPKLRLLLSQNFGHSYFSQIKLFLRIWRQYLISFKIIFPRVYNMPQSKFIWPLLSRGLWSGVKFPI
jgi:hypothetical protein